MAHVSLVCGSEFLYGFKDRVYIAHIRGSSLRINHPISLGLLRRSVPEDLLSEDWSYGASMICYGNGRWVKYARWTVEPAVAGMAMELHCAPNLFTTFLGIYDYTESMDRFLEQFDRKFIRKVMLKHEEIFKQQVHELHRLYRVQKMLMAEMDMKLKSLPNTATTTAVTDSRTRFGSSTSTSETSQSSNVSLIHHPIAQLNSNYSALPRCATMLPSSQEAEDPLRTLKNFNLELSAEEDTDPGVGTTQDKTSLLRKHLKKTMSMEGRDMLTDGEIDVELTLSNGCGFSEKKPRQWLDPNIGLGYSKSAPTENRKLLLSTPMKPERGEECSDLIAGFDRESLQRPGWLLQALSLNRA